VAETAQNHGAFSLRLVAGKRLYELAAWPGAESALQALLGELTARLDEGSYLLHVGPSRYWLLELERSILDVGAMASSADSLAITDLSHSHTLFQLSGDRVRDVLRKGLPIDLHPRVFPEGSMAASAIEGIRVVLVHNESHYDLLCPRSFTASMRHWLLDAALEFTHTDLNNGEHDEN
jgi:heterotetrameric sarcosine oxidase gamma subunit